MRKHLLLLAALIGLQGCFLPASKPTLTMHADKAFTGPERSCINDSADQWRSQTSGLANIHVVYDYESGKVTEVVEQALNHRILRWTSNTPVLVEYEAELNEDLPEGAEVRKILGQVGTKDGIHNEWKLPVEMRLVADRLDDPHVCRLTAIHEFGHVLGVPHIRTTSSNIMWPYIHSSRSACLKKDDLLAFCMLNNCGNVQMKPCEE